MPPRIHTMPKPRVPKSQAGKLRHYFPAFFEWRQANRGGIILPLPPNKANAEMQWRARQQAMETYAGLCATLQSTGLLPEPPEDPPTHAFITVTLYTERAHDWDNLVSRCKPAIDWLARNGYLAGDSPEHLSWLGMPRQRRCPKAHQRIEFVVQAARYPIESNVGPWVVRGITESGSYSMTCRHCAWTVSLGIGMVDTGTAPTCPQCGAV